jgi:nucleoid-associated protein YgaU
MDQSLAALIASGAGPGGPANPNSRYYGVQTADLTLPDGTTLKYLARRIIPPPGTYPSTTTYVIADGDRLDNLAQRFLGDPALYWTICDANGAADPDELTAQPGRAIVIPVPAAIPPGARSG